MPPIPHSPLSLPIALHLRANRPIDGYPRPPNSPIHYYSHLRCSMRRSMAIGSSKCSRFHVDDCYERSSLAEVHSSRWWAFRAHLIVQKHCELHLSRKGLDSRGLSTRTYSFTAFRRRFDPHHFLHLHSTTVPRLG